MGIGVYGVKRPADVDPSDIEVIVLYSKNRNATEAQKVTKLNGTDVIKPVFDPTNTLEVLGGMYNLELPKSVFNAKGFYTVYIRPAQIRVQIEDCAELATFPDIKGLVLNIDSAPNGFKSKFSNNGLDGYRVEYLNDNGSKVQNLYRVITSSFIVEPVQVDTPNSSVKTIKYTYNNVGSLLFCTVTPNAAPSFKPTATPFIGFKGQNIVLTNTSFTPQVLEVELVNYDAESLAIALYSDQTKSMEDGIYTLYDFDGNIYAQYDLYEIKDATNKKLFEVRTRRNNIDSTKTLNNIVGNG
jgi:hypothetical protein